MPLIRWDDSFATGVIEIDEQHRHLIDLINDLHERMKIGKGKEIMSDLLPKMVSYAQYHFGTEERAMLAARYVGYQTHRAEHEEFVKQTAEFVKQAQETQVGLTVPVFTFLKDWMVEHILGSDKEIGAFLRRVGSPSCQKPPAGPS